MKKIASLLIFFLILPSMVNAWGPITHQYVNDQALNNPSIQNSYIVQEIIANRGVFDACYMVTDATIIHYYLDYSRYDATHAPSFADCVVNKNPNDVKLRVCSYGIYAHLIADSVSHQNFVPNRIRATNIPNWIIHPISEGIVETHIWDESNIAYERAKDSLQAYYSDPELQQVLQSCYSPNGNINLKTDVDALNDALGNPDGFYTKLFGLPGIYEGVAFGDWTMGLIALLIGIVLLVVLIKVKNAARYITIPFIIFFFLGAYIMLGGGLKSMTSNVNADYWIQQTIIRLSDIFEPSKWSQRYNYEPTGDAELRRADGETFPVWGTVIGLVVIIIAIFIYRWWKER